MRCCLYRSSWDRGVRLFLALAAVLVMSAAVHAGYTWDGGASPNPYMDQPANWVGDMAPPLDSMTGDELIFAGSTNTSPQIPDLLWDGVHLGKLTFDATASSFTIVGAADDAHTLNMGDTLLGGDRIIQNLSANTQTIDAPVKMYGGTVDTPGGAITFNQPLNIGGGLDIAGADVLFGVESTAAVVNTTYDVILNAGLTGIATPSSGGGHIIKYGSGTLHINADSYATGSIDLWGGNLTIRHGAVRLGSSNALGSTTGTYGCSIGNGDYTGRLELTGDITVGETIRWGGRNHSGNHITNISGNNTLTGNFVTATGGKYYALASDGGKLTIQQTLVSPSTATGTRYLYFRVAPDAEIEIQGQINDQNTGAERVWSYVQKYGAGTLTLSAVNNYSGQTRISGGTLALVGDGAIRSPATSGDSLILLYANTTLDVTGLNAGAYTLDGGTIRQKLEGKGMVRGNTIASARSIIEPGRETVAAAEFTGSLRFEGNLTMQADSRYYWDLVSLTDDTTGTAGTDFDQLVVTGDLVIDPGARLNLYFNGMAAADQPHKDPLNPFWTTSHKWKIIDVDTESGGSNPGNSLFDTLYVWNSPTAVKFSVSVGNTAADMGDIYVQSGPVGVRPPGDADNDGDVDADDAAILASNWLQSISGGADVGDFNTDGGVDDLDASILAANWAYTGGGAAAVPEPGTLAGLLALALGALVLRRRAK